MKDKGITITALAITIVILMILLGVTINSVLNINGIYKKSGTITEQYQNGADQEEEDIYFLQNRLESGKIKEYEAEGIIKISGDKNQDTDPKVTVEIEHKYDLGIKLKECKYEVNNSSEELGTESNKYKNSFSSNPQTIEIGLAEGSSYIHVLTVTSDNKRKETISQEINVEKVVHIHEGDSTTGGGCYTNQVAHTHTSECPSRVCGGKYWYEHHTNEYGGEYWTGECSQCHIYRNLGRDPFQSCPNIIYSCGKTVDYLLGCGYEDGQILSYSIKY